MTTPPTTYVEPGTGVLMCRFPDGTIRPADLCPFHGAREVAAQQVLGVTRRTFRTRRRQSRAGLVEVTLITTDHGALPGPRHHIVARLIATRDRDRDAYEAVRRNTRPAERDIADKLFAIAAAHNDTQEKRARRAAGPQIHVLQSP